MVLSLVSRGVVSGLCLVLAKYWYDRREGKERLQAADRNEPTDSAPRYFNGPPAPAAIIDARADSSASSTAAVETIDTPTDEFGNAKARDVGAGDAHRAAAETFSTDTTGAQGNGGQPAPPPTVEETDQGRHGRRKDDDRRVEEALASRDLSTIDTLLEDICDPVLRNRLLRRLVNGHYRRRSDALHRAAFYRAALLQMEEASSILEGIEEIGEPRPQSLEAFKSMAIALDEDGSVDGAIAVCEMALSLGLHDGTKSGFEGRINRLRRRQQPTGTGDSGIGARKVLH